uniref:Thioredoxin domain-containing protein n=1 Tax=Aureoumbra lagunensis TaxID=44058 RepID=A0A7S3K633_9STRA|mmetsp:Transcript_16507/g.24789  ORF Transcript_16507/g.24789 Transcript_16507/m.24789 type:complete len:240 (+) Transcript_16507:58-777(+)
MDLGFANKNQAIGSNTSQLLNQVVGMQETMIDEELNRLDNLDEDDLSKIRAKRISEMKRRQREELEWSKNCHGSLTTLTSTQEFFAAAKASRRFICHFFRPTSHHCVALNGHLTKLAALHKETRFCLMDAEKSPYLCDKLLADPEGNVIIPTILLCKDGKVTYHIRGLQEVGGEHMTIDTILPILSLHSMVDQDPGANKPAFASLDEYRAHCIKSGFYDVHGDDDNFSDDEYTGDIQDA